MSPYRENAASPYIRLGRGRGRGGGRRAICRRALLHQAVIAERDRDGLAGRIEDRRHHAVDPRADVQLFGGDRPARQVEAPGHRLAGGGDPPPPGSPPPPSCHRASAVPRRAGRPARRRAPAPARRAARRGASPAARAAAGPGPPGGRRKQGCRSRALRPAGGVHRRVFSRDVLAIGGRGGKGRGPRSPPPVPAPLRPAPICDGPHRAAHGNADRQRWRHLGRSPCREVSGFGPERSGSPGTGHRLARGGRGRAGTIIANPCSVMRRKHVRGAAPAASLPGASIGRGRGRMSAWHIRRRRAAEAPGAPGLRDPGHLPLACATERSP